VPSIWSSRSIDASSRSSSDRDGGETVDMGIPSSESR
jgi:hypothetical protein